MDKVSKDKKFYDKKKNNPEWIAKQKQFKRDYYYRNQEVCKEKNRSYQKAHYVPKNGQTKIETPVAPN